MRPLSRRRALHLAGTATLGTLAGCSASVFGSEDGQPEYTLNIDSIDVSPVEHALYKPDNDDLFGQPATIALDEILPTGRHTTYGYKPLPDDAYVEHEDTYYQTENIVTGRRDVKRTVVQVSPVDKDDVPDNAILVDSLQRPTARVLKILHSYTQTDGTTSSADLLHGDAYVLRRPAEQQSRLGSGDLNGRVVTMTDSGTWAYRVHVTREVITEPAYTALAIPVADSRETFREVVFESRIDAELAPENIPQNAQRILEEAIAKGQYAETAPLSTGFKTVLELLGVDETDSQVMNGRLLWYDEGYYRYSRYINTPS
ncbi:hypothetical protein [Haloarcula nitratireducens]|uniref:Uncharacterized protein n=1 Tax=Haloarcula nitratireducens TaxID=2487749 RepID=A0AAW4PII4_9EURY|nr:hypothetical protein [Halomicroarcula nitratireducens]MBX0297250.1 hypothetical protein [Halomicroarcula nitratireducens]